MPPITWRQGAQRLSQDEEGTGRLRNPRGVFLDACCPHQPGNPICSEDHSHLLPYFPHCLCLSLGISRGYSFLQKGCETDTCTWVCLCPVWTLCRPSGMGTAPAFTWRTQCSYFFEAFAKFKGLENSPLLLKVWSPQSSHTPAGASFIILPLTAPHLTDTLGSYFCNWPLEYARVSLKVSKELSRGLQWASVTWTLCSLCEVWRYF